MGCSISKSDVYIPSMNSSTEDLIYQYKTIQRSSCILLPPIKSKDT